MEIQQECSPVRLGRYASITNGLTNTSVYTLAIDPVTPTTLYVGTYAHTGTPGGVFKSIDGGDCWTAINNGLTNDQVRALAIDPATPTTLYAGTDGGGAFKTTNAGDN